jgi:serine protease Do
MWSFDDEENTPGQDNTEAPKGTTPEDSRDDFEERDPFSRGGDFYKSYGSGASPEPPKNNKPPRKSGILPAIIACVLIVCLTVSIVYMTGDGFSLAGIGAGKPNVTTVGSTAGNGTSKPDGTTSATQGTAPSMTTGTPTAPNSPTYVSWDAAVVEKCLNASVLITVENVGSGSGVIYTQDGYILTNYHVVSNGENKITVTLFSGDKLEARYIYGDESNDISVIKIEKNDCTFVTASSSPVTYMMPVMVIGNALGKGFNTTQGVVSAPASEVYFSSTYETMTLIRIDAAVNSGNSGGGLFNTSGELVGIVNAKLSGTSTSGATIESMGYAIPMSSVMKCVNDLNQYGYVTGIARLGVTVQNYLEVSNAKVNAIVIQGLTPGGSAEKSGIRAKDILYSLNGETITSFEMLKKMLTAYSVGDSVTLTVLRPTAEAEKQNHPYYYLRACEEVKITLKFVEFNPNK